MKSEKTPSFAWALFSTHLVPIRHSYSRLIWRTWRGTSPDDCNLLWLRYVPLAMLTLGGGTLCVVQCRWLARHSPRRYVRLPRLFLVFLCSAHPQGKETRPLPTGRWRLEKASRALPCFCFFGPLILVFLEGDTEMTLHHSNHSTDLRLPSSCTSVRVNLQHFTQIHPKCIENDAESAASWTLSDVRKRPPVRPGATPCGPTLPGSGCRASWPGAGDFWAEPERLMLERYGV